MEMFSKQLQICLELGEHVRVRAVDLVIIRKTAAIRGVKETAKRESRC